MEIVGFLIIFPLIAAAVLLAVRNDKARAGIVICAAAIIMIASVVLAVGNLFAPLSYLVLGVEGEYITLVTFVVSVICSLYIIAKGVRHKRHFTIFLGGIQLVLSVILELLIAPNVHVERYLYIDQFSLIMALIIGIIGGGICIYAVGYMRAFQKHEDEHGKPDRRPVFFSVMFLFLSAMYLFVFSNHMGWMFCAWEIMTVSSFALIGYTRTKEAINNSFRQAAMNLVGGIAFCIALIMLGSFAFPLFELDSLIQLGSMGFFMFPIMLFAIAGFTKAAQMPFQSWLLGAMVAPTPTSALLHSSTMVKAGVFILIKLAPCFGFNINGMTVILVGALTFLFCSAVAISQSNAKRVLAYSTVANLGLITACAGIGTPEAVWAAIFLLIFHAAAKSLLFMCVGTAEHHIGSRDIEDMDLLFERMPKLALLMALGMLCMFIAPFGMLISKWATIVSIVDSGNIGFLIILIFGSALTFVFWAKWLGKILAIAHTNKANQERRVNRSEWFSLGLMAILVLALSIAFPWVSAEAVVPYLKQIGIVVSGGLNALWLGISPTIDFESLLVLSAIVIALLVLFVIQFMRKRPKKGADIYLSGVGLDFEKRSFRNSLSGETEATQRNWYLGRWFGEAAVLPIAHIVTAVVMVVGFLLAYAGIGGVS